MLNAITVLQLFLSFLHFIPPYFPFFLSCLHFPLSPPFFLFIYLIYFPSLLPLSPVSLLHFFYFLLSTSFIPFIHLALSSSFHHCFNSVLYSPFFPCLHPATPSCSLLLPSHPSIHQSILLQLPSNQPPFSPFLPLLLSSLPFPSSPLLASIPSFPLLAAACASDTTQSQLQVCPPARAPPCE